jgi:hypothetical protein
MPAFKQYGEVLLGTCKSNFFFVLFQLKSRLFLAHSLLLIKVRIVCLLFSFRTAALSTATKVLDRPDSWAVLLNTIVLQIFVYEV